MKNKNQIFLAIISLVVFTGLLVVFLINRSQLQKTQLKEKRSEEEPTVEISPSPTLLPLPTKTEEEKEIIRNIETHEVKITATGFEPASLTIKPNDQVEWVNETQASCKLEGENWGGLEIRPERKFTESFEKTGLYPYSCQEQPEITGEIVVE